MKNRSECRFGNEGRLIAAALIFLLALCLFVRVWRAPREEKVLPIHAVDAQALARVEMVNINLADAARLDALPGIGRALAERIVEYRAEHGYFAAVEEIMNVPGVGEGKFEAMRDLIYVE